MFRLVELKIGRSWIKSYIHLHDPKNREPFTAYMRQPLKELLIRLRKNFMQIKKFLGAWIVFIFFQNLRFNGNFPESILIQMQLDIT